MSLERGFDLNSVMTSGRLMRLKLDMEKFEGAKLDLDAFVMVLKNLV